MTFPNAFHGVKKIFTAQILSLIGAACVLIAGLFVIVAAASLTASSSTGVIGGGIGTILFGAAAAVLPIIGYIMNLVGLYQASKDEAFFKTAFTVAIFTLILVVVAAILNGLKVGSGVADNVVQCISTIGEIIVTLLVIQGITVLANKLNCDSVIALGTKVLVIYCILYGIVAVIRFLPVFFVSSATLATIEGVLSIISGVVSIVAYIVYLVYLGKAKEMLRTN